VCPKHKRAGRLADQGKPMQSQPDNHAVVGASDTARGGESDQKCQFGHRPRATATYPFSMRQYEHLLVLRSRAQSGLFAADDLQPWRSSS
jgi:hypothetical protein